MTKDLSSKETKKSAGRPRKGDGRRVHISGRVDEFVLQEIHSQMTSQEFIDYAAEKFMKEKSSSKKPIKKPT